MMDVKVYNILIFSVDLSQYFWSSSCVLPEALEWLPSLFSPHGCTSFLISFPWKNKSEGAKDNVLSLFSPVSVHVDKTLLSIFWPHTFGSWLALGRTPGWCIVACLASLLDLIIIITSVYWQVLLRSILTQRLFLAGGVEPHYLIIGSILTQVSYLARRPVIFQIGYLLLSSFSVVGF